MLTSHGILEGYASGMPRYSSRVLFLVAAPHHLRIIHTVSIQVHVETKLGQKRESTFDVLDALIAFGNLVFYGPMLKSLHACIHKEKENQP